MRGNVLLGTSDSTDISITKCVISDANVLGVDTTTGYLKLIICESGGKRLIKNIGHEPTITVIENPVKSSVLELECDVIESGNYSLEIIDILGNVQKVKEWIVTSKDTDKFKFSIPTDNYGNGNYIVVMNTPSAKFHKRFLILK
ncbi:hypothetical protein SDC9_186220 [bioreactor metagenome]|uniref:Secretion system C-terminal sorting domain-containing protein n=1 Tax=bioreactor metagenome TaxID=1076179 RepID=A0A645HI56_9ZZZZ